MFQTHTAFLLTGQCVGWESVENYNTLNDEETVREAMWDWGIIHVCECISVRPVWAESDRRESDAGSEMEGSVTAANQITVSLGCLMSALFCDSLLTALSTMKECKTRFSQLDEVHQNRGKTKS